MPVLILAPVLEVFKDRIDLEFWVFFQVPVDGDISPVPYFLGQVCGIEDELGFEESVFSGLCEEPQVQRQIKIRQSFVQKPAQAKVRLVY